MPLSPETLREIDGLVRGGFEKRDRRAHLDSGNRLEASMTLRHL
jgi:hypothetical protein